MRLAIRFTLFFSVSSLIFLGCFSIVVYREVRDKIFSQAELSLSDLLNHEWDHLELPQHQAHKGEAPHFKNVYVRIRKDNEIIFDSFAEDIREPKLDGMDVAGGRIVRRLQREKNGSHYDMIGYFDLRSTYVYLESLRNVLAYGCALSILLLIPFSLWATKYLLLPFRRLARQTAHISANKLSYRFEVPPQHDEYGHLARNFNRLLERLESGFLQVRRFASNASHELRTPLAVIVSQTDLALRKTRSPEEYQLVLEKVLERANDLSRIVERLMELSDQDRLQSSEKDDIRLSMLLRETANSIIAIRGEGTKKVELVGDELSSVKADRQIFMSIFSNLLENAIKFSKNNVRIGWKKGESTVITIEDDGPGIPESLRQSAFEPFVRLSNAQGIKGQGLGLSIVKACAEAIQAEIKFDVSDLGGLRVDVVLNGMS